MRQYIYIYHKKKSACGIRDFTTQHSHQPGCWHDFSYITNQWSTKSDLNMMKQLEIKAKLWWFQKTNINRQVPTPQPVAHVPETEVFVGPSTSVQCWSAAGPAWWCHLLFPLGTASTGSKSVRPTRPDELALVPRGDRGLRERWPV